MQCVNKKDKYAGYIEDNDRKCLTCVDSNIHWSTCDVAKVGLAFCYVAECHVNDGDRVRKRDKTDCLENTSNARVVLMVVLHKLPLFLYHHMN